jgi:hypothetical protein
MLVRGHWDFVGTSAEEELPLLRKKALPIREELDGQLWRSRRVCSSHVPCPSPVPTTAARVQKGKLRFVNPFVSKIKDTANTGVSAQEQRGEMDG